MLVIWYKTEVIYIMLILLIRGGGIGHKSAAQL